MTLYLCIYIHIVDNTSLPPRIAQMVSHSVSLAQENRQRDQELLEHQPQEKAHQNGHRPHYPQAKDQLPRPVQQQQQGHLQSQPHGSVGECQARS